MDPKLLVIPIGFILLAAVLCWQLADARGPWPLRLMTVVLVPAFGLSIWSAMPSYKGWPTSDPPPEKALFLWSAVREPNPFTGDPGAIYVWLVPLPGESTKSANPLGYEPARQEPRAYRLTYSRPTHQMVEGAMGAVQQGRPVVFGRAGQGQGQGREGQDGQEGQAGQNGQPGGPNGQGGPQGQEDDQGHMVYELPPPTMPPKASQ